MHEIHIGADVALFFRMNWRRTGNKTWLKQQAWPVVAATADFYASRMERRVVRCAFILG
jgi:trehalose/maltose hydrolase-like predicted phosphorylase